MKKKPQMKSWITGIIAVIVLLIGGTKALPTPLKNFVEKELFPKSEQVQKQDKQQSASSTKAVQKSTITEQSQPATTTGAPYDSSVYNQLAALEFKSGEAPVLEVNGNHSTLSITDWKTNKVIYGNLDSLNRTTYALAYIDKSNLGKSEGRDRQVWSPTGWHQKKVDGQPIYNRGHLLAYTSSFNLDEDGNYRSGEEGSLDNPKNLATQSAFSNQRVQTNYESMVRKAQAIKGNKVIYQIVTVFRGDELMPRGYWLQAIDSAHTLDFNVYEFNVQPHVVFNYQDGTSTIDRSMQVTN